MSNDEKERYKEQSDVDRKRYEVQKYEYDTQKEEEIKKYKEEGPNREKDDPRQAAVAAKKKLNDITHNKGYEYNHDNSLDSLKKKKGRHIVSNELMPMPQKIASPIKILSPLRSPRNLKLVGERPLSSTDLFKLQVGNNLGPKSLQPQ